MALSPKEFHDWMHENYTEGMKLPYGHCPRCNDACQPDCIPMDCESEEWVECENCGIMWTLYHDEPDDKHDETEPWRTYRIGEIELA